MAPSPRSATLRTRVPFVHFFDGFRTSHELNTLEMLSDDDLRASCPSELVHRAPRPGAEPRAPLHPRHRAEPGHLLPVPRDGQPVLRQGARHRPTAMDEFAELTGRAVPPGRVPRRSGGRAGHRHHGLRRSRPSSRPSTTCWRTARRSASSRSGSTALPDRGGCSRAARQRHPIAVLDRTKEPGAWRRAAVPGRHLGPGRGRRDGRRATAAAGHRRPLRPVVSKEFTPAMARRSSTSWPPSARVPGSPSASRRRHPPEPGLRPDARHRGPRHAARGVLRPRLRRHRRRQQEHHQDPRRGPEGTFAQGYFVYDSKKSGVADGQPPALRPEADQGALPGQRAGFIGCHHWSILERVDVLEFARRGTCRAAQRPPGPRSVWDQLPEPMQRRIIDKGCELYAIDANSRRPHRRPGQPHQHRAADLLLRHLRVLPRDEAIEKPSRSRSARPTAARSRGGRQERAAVDAALAHLHRVEVPAAASDHSSGSRRCPPRRSSSAT
jgi:pyruvate-ferredoxin/flavodoxin oxidoreductase